MCLPMGSCFGAPRTDDDLGPPNKHVAPPSRVQRNGAGGHYYNGTNYAAHGAAAGAEADRKASNDVVRKGPAAHAVPTGAGAAAAATRGWHGGHAATGAQEKAAVYPYAGADGTLKQQPAAPNGRVAAADGARGVAHSYYYYEPAHREDAADSYYPAATAADHGRY